MKKKHYLAYTIHRSEYGCGCPRTNLVDCTNKFGKKEFETYEEAKKAAINQADKLDADDWGII